MTTLFSLRFSQALAPSITHRRASQLAVLLVMAFGWTTPAASRDTSVRTLLPHGAAGLPRQLLAHWRFDEIDGTLAMDETGSHPGQLSAQGALLGEAGIAGSALRLIRDQGGYVDVGSGLALLDMSFSIGVWVRIPEGDATLVAPILTKHRPGSGNGYGLLFNEVNVPDGAERIGAFVGDYGPSVDQLSFPRSQLRANDGRWHHLVLVYAPDSTLSLFVDGSLADVDPARPTTASPANTLIGGLDYESSKHGRFEGSIDDIQIYDFALSPDEVAFLHAHPGLTVVTDLAGTVIQPPGGIFTNEVRVALLTGIPGAELRFTRDGTDPTPSSELYTGSLTLTTRTTLKARAYVNGFPVGEIAAATFEPAPVVQIQPPGGPFTNLVEVQVFNRLPQAVIRYTIDGTDPTPASPAWNAPLRLTAATQIRVQVYLDRFPVSDVLVADFHRVYALDDGIPAAWREQYFGPGYLTDPRVAAEADPDGDGASNRQEFAIGTHPLDPLSGFAVGIRAVPEIRFQAVPGQRYRIVRRDAVTGSSVIVADNLTAATTSIRYVDTDVSAPAAFYIVEPIP